MISMEGKPEPDSGFTVSNVPRGIPKSGRIWKSEHTKRHSELIKVKPLKSSWKEKMEIKAKQRAIKIQEKELREAKAREKEEKRKRTEINRKRKLENEKKAEILQPIKNKAKIKRTRKKQLRKLKAKK